MHTSNTPHNTSARPPSSRAKRWAMACLFCCAPAWAQLDVNQASEADLDSLRGVGPALTARILAQRAQAPFADWADLMRRVKGLRAATARHLATQGLTVNGQTLAPAATGDAQ